LALFENAGGRRRQGTYNTANCPHYCLRINIRVSTVYSRHGVRAQFLAVIDICGYAGDEHDQVDHYDQVMRDLPYRVVCHLEVGKAELDEMISNEGHERFGKRLNSREWCDMKDAEERMKEKQEPCVFCCFYIASWVEVLAVLLAVRSLMHATLLLNEAEAELRRFFQLNV